MKYACSCHCGKVKYEAEGDIELLTQCNCSICSKRGYLLWFVPRENFKLLTPENELNTYTFNKHKIKHHFCKTCGCAPFGEGVGPTGKAMAAINARCLDGVDLTPIKIKQFNGRDL